MHDIMQFSSNPVNLQSSLKVCDLVFGNTLKYQFHLMR